MPKNQGGKTMKEIVGWKFKPRWDEEPNKIEIKWNFFSGGMDRIAAIYGRNGSGKSTFAKAVSFFKENKSIDFEYSFPVDINGNMITQVDKDSFFVFDEAFIQEQVGFKDDSSSLNAIVMFGKNKNLDEELKKLEKEKNSLIDEKDKIDIVKFDTKDSGTCLSQIYDNINANLKQHWAQRDKEIKGNSRASSLPVNIIQNIESVKGIELSYDELSAKFQKKLNKYRNTKKDINLLSLIDNKSINALQTNLGKIDSILKAEFPKPISDDLEKKILTELQNDKTGFLTEKTNEILNTDKHYCPCCFQEISQNYKLRLKQAFNNVINKEVQAFKNDIKNISLDSINIDFDSLIGKIQNDKLLLDCKTLVNKINSKIAKLIEQLKEKYNNPYISSHIEGFDELKKDLISLFDKVCLLNKEICEFNEIIKNSEKIANQLHELNNQLAYLEINDLYTNYQRLAQEKEQSVKKREEKQEAIDKINQKIDLTKSQIKNTNVALESINKDLALIFGTTKSIKLYPDSKGNYRITSHGRKVKLDNVSVGERNAIAIAYFFSIIKTNDIEGQEYSHPLFLVIDDPVSSFDRDNKFGVFTLLKSKLTKIIRRNSESKCVVLTHDLMCIGYLNQMLNGVTFQLENSTYSLKVPCFIINNKSNELEKCKNMDSEYRTWLRDIYLYAYGDSSSYDGSNQNELRRILEAYFTFNYGLGYKKLISEGTLLKKISDGKVREYYETSALKMVLDTSSHSENAIKFEENGIFGYDLDIGTEDERKQTVKDLLCLLYSLDSLHVISLIRDNTKKVLNENTIKNTFGVWIEELKSRIY